MSSNPITSHDGPSVVNATDDQEFPALSTPGRCNNVVIASSLLPAYHAAKITKHVGIPCEHLKLKDDDKQASSKLSHAQTTVCSRIARDTNVDIKLTRNKSQVLFTISGSQRDVEKAEQLLLRRETKKLPVLRQYHAFLIGKGGSRLDNIQASTLTRITIPSASSADPNTITITGPLHGIIEAERLIHETIVRQSNNAFEQLDIPKVFHPFICGPNNQKVDSLRTKTGTQINIPPPPVPASVISVVGKRDGVDQAVKEIQAIYDQVKSYKTITVTVKKSQHEVVSGPRGSGLSEILAATGVSVEIPNDSTSEEIVLRGRPEDMGRALSMVYERALSSVTEVVRAPNRLHKFLIGKQGSAIAELREGYKKVNIDFGDNQDNVCVTGPPEEVAAIVSRLEARVSELEEKLAIDTIRVDPKYFRHIIGRQGATVLRLCENNVQIWLPTLNRDHPGALNEIVIQGHRAGVEKVKSEIEQLVRRLESEKCKDVIIEPSVQELLRSSFSGNPAPIRQIYDAFPKVSIVWPCSEPNSKDPTESVVQLRGDRQQVDAAAERLSKLIKHVVENNFRQEIRIFSEFRPHIFGKGSSKIKKLLEETGTRLQSPPDSSDLFTLIGREANVQQAVRQIEEMQKKLANVKEINVSIPSALTKRFVGNQAPSIRFILDQCPGVHMRFSTAKTSKAGYDDVVMIGPQEDLEKAKTLVDQMNSKVAKLCAEELVRVDPKFHGFLIGRHGANITRFRERHNVELVFPDRLESNPELASEIRIVGSKDSVSQAKLDLEAQVKSIEDEVEQSVAVNPDLLHEILDYRRTSSLPPELNEVRLFMPKSVNPPSNDLNEVSSSRTANIRLVGQKACVEAAVEALQSLLREIESRVTREFPITDPAQFATLDRMRSRFRAFERENRVLISLQRPTSMDGPVANGDDNAICETPQSHGCLIITGPRDRIDMVYENKILPLLPVEEEFAVPKQFHRMLISVPPKAVRERNGGGPTWKANASNAQPEQDGVESCSKATDLKQKYGVTVRLPHLDVDSNTITLRGTPDQLSAAKTELEAWVKDCEARNFTLTLEVPSRFIQTLIARRPKLVAKYDIRMRFGPDLSPNKPSLVPDAPDADVDGSKENHADSAVNSDDANNLVNGGSTEERAALIILHGYADRVNKAKEELESTISKLQRQITEELYIPTEVHSLLIGSHGSAIQKVMRDYRVTIVFPSRQARESGQANAVLVTGDPEDVDNACDFLINKANNLMDRFGSDDRQSVQREQQYRIDLLPTAATTTTDQ